MGHPFFLDQSSIFRYTARTMISSAVNKNIRMRSTTLAVISWVVLVLTILYLNLCTPPLSDDWNYNCLYWEKVIPHTWMEYFLWNPRVSGTFFTRVFALLPNGIVDLINTVLLLSMYVGIVCIAAGNQWKSIILRWYTPLLLFGITLFLMIAPGQIILWHCGVASYLLPMLAGMIIILSFMHSLCLGKRWNPSIAMLVVYLIVTFILGMGTFNLAGGIFLFGCILAYRTHTADSKKLKIKEFLTNQWKLILVLLMIITCQLLVVISPANNIRLNSSPPEDLIDLFNGGFEKHISDLIDRLFNIHVFRIVWVYAAIIIGYVIRRIYKNWTSKDSYIVYGFTALFIISELAIFMSPVRVAERVYAPGLMFMMIAAFRVLFPIFESGKKLIRWAASIYLLIWMLLIIPASVTLWEQKVWWDKAEKQLSGDKETITLPYCPLSSGFLKGHSHLLLNHSELSTCAGNQIARVYGKKGVYMDNTRAIYTRCDGQRLVLCDDIHDFQKGQLSYLPSSDDVIQSDQIIWYPTSNKLKWFSPCVMWKRFCYREKTQLNAEELHSMGYTSDTLKKGKIEWSTYPKIWSRPQVPTIWLPSAHEKGTYERCEGKPSWH